MKLAVNVEKSFFDIPLKEQMLSVEKAGFDGVFFDWSDTEEFKENTLKAWIFNSNNLLF